MIWNGWKDPIMNNRKSLSQTTIHETTIHILLKASFNLKQMGLAELSKR